MGFVFIILQYFYEYAYGSSIATMIDNIKYDYTGNRLTKVTDEQMNPSGYPLGGNDISYDDNGNMLNQLDKNMASIQYNYLNLPKQITQNAKVTNTTYRADGVKVKKLFGDIETDYLDGFQYKSTFSQESWNGVGTYIPDPNEIPVIKLRIIPTSEGYYDALLGKYIYNFTDHLGNVRLSYSDANKDGIIQPRDYSFLQCGGKKGCTTIWNPGEIVEVNNYYPFGLLHNYTATTQNAYQYKYNGKELQETGQTDFGARMYMNDLGRWGVVDQLAEKYQAMSPYNYVANYPILFIDPDGKDIILSLGFDKYAAETKVRYDGGKLYQYAEGKRSDIEYTGDISNVSGLVSDLDKLSANSAGKSELIDFFSQEGNDIKIVHDDNENQYLSGEKKIEVTGESVELPTTEGLRATDSYVVLGHEMGHAKSDLQKKEGKDNVWYKKANGSKVTIDEIQASHTENKIRKAAGLPLRVRYNNNAYSTTLLTNDNKKSLHINKKQDYPTQDQVEDNYEY